MAGRERMIEDIARANALAHRYLAAQVADSSVRRRVRFANAFLLAEFIITVAATYIVIYAAPWPVLLIVVVPWSIVSSLFLDNAVHYLNHWPPFRHKRLNALWRAAGALVFFNVVEIRHHHWQHHRDLEIDAATTPGWNELIREWWSSISSLWQSFPPLIADLRRTHPDEYVEIVIIRAASAALLILLVVLAPARTLLIFIPSMFVVGPFCSLLMNVTDHSSGDSTNPFRQATWLEATTRAERIASAVNHFTAATHLTHHLFPQVHWILIRDLQRELAPLYRAYAAPRSLIVNSTLLGNPFRLLRVIGSIANGHV